MRKEIAHQQTSGNRLLFRQVLWPGRLPRLPDIHAPKKRVGAIEPAPTLDDGRHIGWDRSGRTWAPPDAADIRASRRRIDSWNVRPQGFQRIIADTGHVFHCDRSRMTIGVGGLTRFQDGRSIVVRVQHVRDAKLPQVRNASGALSFFPG